MTLAYLAIPILLIVTLLYVGLWSLLGVKGIYWAISIHAIIAVFGLFCIPHLIDSGYDRQY